ncbi:MAG TPA: hypothetical protein VFQ80_05230 [Thermomicrobiales bacterium]|nr:hypothetical protein [Thermomicrobiales bacterium]
MLRRCLALAIFCLAGVAFLGDPAAPAAQSAPPANPVALGLVPLCAAPGEAVELGRLTIAPAADLVVQSSRIEFALLVEHGVVVWTSKTGGIVLAPVGADSGGRAGLTPPTPLGVAANARLFPGDMVFSRTGVVGAVGNEGKTPAALLYIAIRGPGQTGRAVTVERSLSYPPRWIGSAPPTPAAPTAQAQPPTQCPT